MRSWIRVSVLAPCALVTIYQSANAQQLAANAPAAPAATSGTAAAAAQGDLDEIVVNGIKRGDLILPTQVTSGSAYGLDLNVMDTPRNNTLLSKAQLDALNIQNPGGFSYLTSSSYSDAAFGQPNVPRIRGQYADLFFNGMRDSFTLNGYGAPISFNSVETVDIIKGPASVQGGPGAGVGGSIDITTKMPSLTKLQGTYQVEFDTQQKRRASFDINDPLTASTAVRVSFATDDSGSYYNNMYFHQQSFFISALTQVTDKYSVVVTAGFEDTRYRENDGLNHVNQALIDDGAYLTGGAVTPITGFGTEVFLGAPRQISDRIIIDEPDGNGAHSVHAKGQLIQTYTASDTFSITNNLFYDYLNRYNQVEAYYADTAKGSYTVEDKTDFKVKFSLGSVKNDVDAGFTYRYAHVLDIQNYANEPVSVFDLSGNPNSWVFPAYGPGTSNQLYGGAIPYTAAFGHQQFGVPGTYGAYANGTIDSNLQDAAIFLEHRLEFSPQWSVLYGLRGDLVQLNDSDPLYALGLAEGDAAYPDCGEYCINTEPSQHTPWYGLYNGNISVVWSPSEHISTYLTYNKAQYVDANANDGAVGTLGVDPTTQLRQKTLLEEAGLKFDLLDKSLFISTAIFKQERAVPVGVGGLTQSLAHIKGAEIEMNYQPDPHFFATASYSYLHTMLDSPSDFWNFPAQAGVNYDGAGLAAAYNPNQRFLDPGVPQHLFNVLANYKMDSGLGFQGNIQVTGPLDTTQSGYLNIAATNGNAYYTGTQPLVGPGGIISSSVVSANGYYKSPQIPWQYTMNVAAFYTWQDKYTVKFSIYNLTSRQNLTNDYPFYGNDFLTRDPPRSFDLTLSGKF